MTTETDLNNLPDWNMLHFGPAPVDLRALDPLLERTNCPRPHEGGVASGQRLSNRIRRN